MNPRVTRLPLRLAPDSSRVITRFFSPGDQKRSREIIERVLAFPEQRDRTSASPSSSEPSAPTIPIFTRSLKNTSSRSRPRSRLTRA